MKKVKTIADLKRDATNKKISFELIERYGETGNEIPERLRGIRTAGRVNTVGIMLVDANGRDSELRLPSAKLVEYEDDYLTIYNPGERDLKAEEKQTLEKWAEIEKRIHDGNPYRETYWLKKDYFSKEKCSCPWMSGWETIRGKKYNYCTGKVIDNQIRGEAILKYKIHRV